jgi:uncharacterized membrane protein (DUF2068 family)
MTAPPATRPRSSRWELRACARKGHETYHPTGPGEEALAERLRAETPQGQAWRCLRCGDFVPGAPRATGPADAAPVVLRGRPLRDAVILRLLAVERGLRAVVLFAAAYAIRRFRLEQGSLQRLFDKDLPAFRELGQRLNIDVDSSAIVRGARHLLSIRPSTLGLVSMLVAVYAATQAAEAVGLWLLKRWGEYLTVVATSAFVPLEVFELTHHLTVTKVLALVVNLAAVVYLVVSKRLFGTRGGRGAYDAERRAESLLEVEQSALVAPAAEPGTSV